MTLRELHKKLEKRAMTEKAGILPNVECVDRATIERRASYTLQERDRLRADIETRQADRIEAVIGDKTGDALSSVVAIIVRDWLPTEDQIWRLEFEEPEPERAKPEPIPVPEPTWEQIRDHYEAENARRRAERSPDA